MILDIDNTNSTFPCSDILRATKYMLGWTTILVKSQCYRNFVEVLNCNVYQNRGDL